MYNDCYGLIMDIQSIDQQNVCESCLDNDPSYVITHDIQKYIRQIIPEFYMGYPLL